MIRALAAGLAAATAFAAAPAVAQDSSGRPDRRVSIAVGAQMLPSYPGSDDYEFNPLFTGFSRREGEPIPFRTPDDGISISLIGADSGIDFGPLVQFQGERDDEDVGAAVGDVDFTVEVGGFVNLNLTDSLRFRFEGQKGIGGHEGITGAIAFDAAIRPNVDTLITIGPRVRFNDDDYANAYFSITPAVAQATGLPVYDADGGARSVGLIAGITRQITRSFGVYGYAGYDRLISDAADSPIVQRFGSEDQFSAGVSLFFTFGL